jgi:hypothetical protein
MSLGPGESRRRAAAPLVQALGQGKRKLALRWLLWRRGEALRESDAAWGQVGFALTKSNRLAAVADWMSDWRKRESAEPWMLFNYCLGLRHVGRYEEASEVASYVTSHWTHLEGAGDMYLFMAIEQALAGKVTEARENLARAQIREDVAYDKQMSVLTRALCDFEATEHAQRRSMFVDVRARLNVQFDGILFLSTMRDVRRTFRRAEKVFVRGGAGLTAWLWFKWKMYWQWLMLPPAAAIFYGVTLVSPAAYGAMPLVAIFAIVRLFGARSR